MTRRLSVDLPAELELALDSYIPWGSKGPVVVELLYQLTEECKRTDGKCIYELIQAGQRRGKDK